MLKYDKNSYANVGTIWMYLGNTGVLQYYVIIDWDATWFSCIRWKINPLKKVLKKSSCLGLIEFLGENKSLSNAEIEDFSTFIQTAPCSGTIYESCVITRIRMYDNHKTKTSMILTPDLDFATQFILQVHYHCYYYVLYHQEELSPISFRN